MNLLQRECGKSLPKVDRKQAFDIQSLIGNDNDNSRGKTENRSSYITDEFLRVNQELLLRKCQDFPASSHSCFHQRYFDRDCYPSCHHAVTQAKPHAQIPVEHTLRTGVVIPSCHYLRPIDTAEDCYVNRTACGPSHERFPPVSNSTDLFSTAQGSTTANKQCQHWYGRCFETQKMHQNYGLPPSYSPSYPHNELVRIPSGSRRMRTTFTPSQLKVLERRFKSSHYIVGEERKQLAQELNLNESQVKIWFQNRRTKFKQDRQFEEMGATKINKRRVEHHVRKWQLETNALEFKDGEYGK